MNSSPLFTPYNLGPLTLKNRIVMAPMTREKAPAGVPTKAMVDYYARRARGGVGLIVTEGIAPCDEGSFGAAVPRLIGEDAVNGWKQVVRAVHAEGAAIFAQIWHVGAFSPSLIGMADSLPASLTRLSPSGLAARARPMGRSMSEADLERTTADIVAACASAEDCGFDGVELHGAHGYLLDQFLWADTNRRRDRLGGSAAERTRFVAELISRTRDATAPEFTVALRLSQWKQLDYRARIASDPAALASILDPLVAAGVDLFHCSTRRFWEPEFADDPRNLAAWVKVLTGKPVVTVGSVTLDVDFKAPMGKVYASPSLEHVRLLEAAIAGGQFDLVAVGRALIANPDWAQLVANGQSDKLRPFERQMLDTLH